LGSFSLPNLPASKKFHHFLLVILFTNMIRPLKFFMTIPAGSWCCELALGLLNVKSEDLIPQIY
jgi:hypothetical protein